MIPIQKGMLGKHEEEATGIRSKQPPDASIFKGNPQNLLFFQGISVLFLSGKQAPYHESREEFSMK